MGRWLVISVAAMTCIARSRGGCSVPERGACRSVPAVGSPPALGDKSLLELQPALVRGRRCREVLPLFIPFGFGDDDVVAGGVITADLALQEVGSTLEKVKHYAARIGRAGAVLQRPTSISESRSDDPECDRSTCLRKWPELQERSRPYRSGQGARKSGPPSARARALLRSRDTPCHQRQSEKT